MRRLTVALACVALALVPACGGGDEDTQTPRAPVPTIPEAGPPAGTEAETLTEEPDSPVVPEPEPEPAPAPAPDPGGAVAPTEPEPPVDSPENDLPPPPGSEAEDFEEFCDSNPGACG